ncbi:E3 ubiquitin-protein ligase TRIM39-like [Betta splendens]|uniref:E3 ubiquitin-protein ligase TRIM39-like n=1 Tax=Betta splendens TaxID=158456 RepID=A0A6P7MSN4_BETSP|nr:E3 ubiquitin-protein ligase TRIM39-like [Betta splendens]XP_029009924.1 E3 ubiquitin-protein ligase TRIM39-like [Betta splendens]
MAAASCLHTEDQFLCSICLDIFTDPVTLPCGHNFCKSCIAEHWNCKVKRQCPVCNTHYNKGLKLQVNTFISEMAAQFRQSAQHKTSSSEQHAAKPGDVPCDVCTGPELKALKSCLVCLTSYCETHLEPHLTKSGLKRHQLIDPVKNLEDRMCKKHDKLLELFCKSDHMCVCMMCAIADHKTHDVVAMKEECEGKKSELLKTDAQIQQMIEKRRVKIEEIRRSVELSNKAADRELEEGVQVFTALKETVERSQAELIKTITEKQRTTEKQAEGFITELQQEICDLKKRSSEVEQLSQSEDHFQIIHSFSSVNTAPPTKEWTDVSLHAPSYEGTVVRAVKQLELMFLVETDKLCCEVELKRVQQYEVDVSLDPDQDSQASFTCCQCVLSMQGFRSQKFYFEVELGECCPWTLGVTSNTNTEGRITLNPQNGYWTVCMSEDFKYYAADKPPVCLDLTRLLKVGVFVDYEQGLVSFYDVDTAVLIHSFISCFTDTLHPFFSSCPNDGIQGSWGSFLSRRHKLYLQ